MMKSDLKLQKVIFEALHDHPTLDARHIGVAVDAGVVTLYGHVNSYGERWAAEQLVRQYPEVMAVAVEMDVQLPESARHSDTEIAHTVEQMVATLIQQIDMPHEHLEITVEQGWIVLRGVVSSLAHLAAIQARVSDIAGVKGISILIDVQPELSVAAVRLEIERALNQRAYPDARQIQLTASGSELVVSGQVQDWAEADLVCSAAWNTPGVSNVINDLEIVGAEC